MISQVHIVRICQDDALLYPLVLDLTVLLGIFIFSGLPDCAARIECWLRCCSLCTF